ncbi:E3 ubiquitin-protein ligase TRIM56-like [Mizuhopecten yessoensis]|uniref:E3 ubiquitin-protein ligase TRIM56 n=1 Tax=Mizuhopecten yessoensis TaxID=6573 RepID=A0A210QP51_MIZYE|nr:E3 ubiquitin-protein ligase TRIM56-like [Mizuhopecten yessoensis]OWF50517.1 E3 ubiquitin-protein ligase TRIM56 [Mizuhopecten yessoensis]
MAALDHTEDLTVCSICLQTLTIPKYLPCLHTFCELCLQGWIESQVTKSGRNIKQVEFTCPVCRTNTRLPSKATATNKSEWASTFPSNHIIVSLIDKSMIEKQKKSCDPCSVMKKDVQATQWCVQCSEAYCGPCSQVHRGMKATRKHKLIGLQDVLRDLKCLSLDEMCNEHADEVIKLFCVDHDQPCCTICGATSHRKCDTVLELSEAAINIKNKKEFSELLASLNECEKDIGKASMTLKEHLTQLEKKKFDIERSAEEFAGTLVTHTKALHSHFLKQLSEAHSRAVNEIKTNAEECSLQQKVISNSRQMLEKSRDNSSDTELFLQVKRTEAKRKDTETFIENEMSKMTLKQVKYSLSEALQEYKNVNSFGDVTVSNVYSVALSKPTSKWYKDGLHRMHVTI